ncbi:MAG: hypothetical protein ACTHQ3_16790, partial [Motilibacteraceae bacterium]
RAEAERERAAAEAARRRAQHAEQTRGERRLELDRLAASLPPAAATPGPTSSAQQAAAPAAADGDHPTRQLPVAGPDSRPDDTAPPTRELGLAEELLALGVDDDPLPRSGRRQLGRERRRRREEDQS